MSRPSALRWLALAAIWGCSFLFIRVGLEGLSQTQVVLGRLLPGAAVLATVVAARRLRLPRDRGLWAHFALLGLTANVVPFFLFSWAEDGRLSSGLAGVDNATTPLWTLLLAVLALPAERPSRTRVAGLLIGFAGVVVVLSPWSGDAHAAGVTLAGNLAAVGASVSYGVSFVWTRRFVSPRGVAPVLLAAGQIGVASVEMLLLTPSVAAQPVHLTARVVGAMLALGVLGTGVAYLLYYALIADVGATTASSVTYAVPVVAVLLGVAVLGEALHLHVVLGGLVVLAGVLVAEGRLRLPERRRDTPMPLSTHL